MAGKKNRGAHALTALGIGFLGLVAYGAGCSLPNRTYVNDLDGGGASGGTTSTTGGKAGSSSTGGTSAKGGSSGANSEAGEAGASSSTGGQTGLNRPVPTKGLIVIGGTAIDQTKGEISVVQPVTGTELNKEMLPAGTQIADIAYDGAVMKDVWYVFIGGVFPAAPDKVVALEVRYFDDVSNKWVTLSNNLTTLPAPVPGTVTVLNDRVAYLSHTLVAGKITPTLTVLDTSDVLNVQVIPYTVDTSQGTLVSLIGTRGTALDPNGVGGTLDLGISENCAGTAPQVCELHELPIAVGSSIVDGASHLIGNYQGTPLAAAGRATTARQTTLQDFFVLSDGTGTVSLYITTPDAPEGANHVPAPQAVTDLASLAIADCQTLGIFTATSEDALYGVTLDFGAGSTLPLGRQGQLVAYEPFSKDIIATYNPPTNGFETAPPDSGVPGPEITAISATSSSSTNLALPIRTKGWAPPTDVRTNVIATRFPVPFTCK
jgi:hypothetical protein